MAEESNRSTMNPQIALNEGVQQLLRVLGSYGFQFEIRGRGKGSGGQFAWGEFVRADRRLEIHVRHGLGSVTYHITSASASHEAYMRELGVWDHCEYPGFFDDRIEAFEALARDLAFADDFLSGSGEMLQKAAAREATISADSNDQSMASVVGDTRKITQLKIRFQKRKYREVISIASELQYPNRLSPSEKQMIKIARERISM